MNYDITPLEVLEVLGAKPSDDFEEVQENCLFQIENEDLGISSNMKVDLGQGASGRFYTTFYFKSILVIFNQAVIPHFPQFL